MQCPCPRGLVEMAGQSALHIGQPHHQIKGTNIPRQSHQCQDPILFLFRPRALPHCRHAIVEGGPGSWWPWVESELHHFQWWDLRWQTWRFWAGLPFPVWDGGPNLEWLLGYSDDIMCLCGNESYCSGLGAVLLCVLFPVILWGRLCYYPSGTTRRLNNLPNSTSTIIDDSSVFVTFPLPLIMNTGWC